MTRDTERAEIEALRRALDTACDEIARQRDNVLAESIRAERAISQRVPKQATPCIVTHAVAFAIGGLTTSLVVWLVGVSL